MLSTLSPELRGAWGRIFVGIGWLGVLAGLGLGAAVDAVGDEAGEPLLDFGEDRYTLSAWVRMEPDAEGGPLFTVGSLNGEWSTGSKCL